MIYENSKDFLNDHQREAVENMKNGCILNGGVGSGKSRTSLYYYFKQNGGSIGEYEGELEYFPMNDPPKDLYIITTARKRDEKDWEKEFPFFLMSTDKNYSIYNHKIIIDSWNNIKKYINILNSFFIFDEDRVVGYGEWVKAFLEITKKNEWILLSATPGDKWSDYLPVFIANGFFKNQKEFEEEHVVFTPFVKYKQIDRYLNVGRLIRLRRKILVDLDCDRHTTQHHEDIFVKYDIQKYKDIIRTRWNPFEDKPIRNASELCYVLRKIVNTDESRSVAVLELFEDHPKVIIFYKFDYELDILKNLYYGDDVEIAEWNGHKHQEIPESYSWVYLVQYTAGAEGWNCIKTDTIIFYSQDYSYKNMIQACGRIDRMNTPFTDLYYYHLKSRSGIDLAISQSIKNKKKFNENRFINRFNFDDSIERKFDEKYGI